MEPASPAGAALIALADRATTSPLAPMVTLRLAKNSFARAEGLPDFFRALVLEVAEQDRVAVR